MRRVAPIDQMEWDDVGIELRRIDLEPGGRADLPDAAGGERFLYVVAGAGAAHAAGAELPLADESVLWLEPGDACRLVAGEHGLSVLAAGVPAIDS